MTQLSPVGALLREWRTLRGKSQLALALDAGVSTRHLSFVETGRASPSRDMVLLLGQTLEVPLREQNRLLAAAGYAAVYNETPLEAPQMEQVRAAIDIFLRGLGANPALVVNRHFDVLQSNAAAGALMKKMLPDGAGAMEKPNLVRLIMSEHCLRPFIENWEDVATQLVLRVRREALGAGMEMAETLAALYDQCAGLTLPHADASRAPDLVLPLVLRKGGQRLAFFSTITSVGTPQDITLQELRIEALFPADRVTAQILSAWAEDVAPDHS